MYLCSRILCKLTSLCLSSLVLSAFYVTVTAHIPPCVCVCVCVCVLTTYFLHCLFWGFSSGHGGTTHAVDVHFLACPGS
jgi:hypothetical protein